MAPEVHAVAFALDTQPQPNASNKELPAVPQAMSQATSSNATLGELGARVEALELVALAARAEELVEAAEARAQVALDKPGYGSAELAALAAKVEAVEGQAAKLTELEGTVREHGASLEALAEAAPADNLACELGQAEGSADAKDNNTELAALAAQLSSLKSTVDEHGASLESMREDFGSIEEAVSTVAMLKEGASEMQEAVDGLQEQVEAQSASVEALEEAAGTPESAAVDPARLLSPPDASSPPDPFTPADHDQSLAQEGHAIFLSADVKNYGTLSKGELKEFIQNNDTLREQLVPSGWQTCFQELDTDGESQYVM